MKRLIDGQGSAASEERLDWYAKAGSWQMGANCSTDAIRAEARENNLRFGTPDDDNLSDPSAGNSSSEPLRNPHNFSNNPGMNDLYIGGKQIPNPKGITPKLDTDPPDPPKNKYMTGDVSNAATDEGRGDQDKMDTSNPPKTEMTPTIHRIAKAAPAAKPGSGRHLPQIHTSRVISEN
jgi:hypothetical protein